MSLSQMFQDLRPEIAIHQVWHKKRINNLLSATFQRPLKLLQLKVNQVCRLLLQQQKEKEKNGDSLNELFCHENKNVGANFLSVLNLSFYP